MLNRIVEAALRYKLLVIIAFAVVAGLGVRAWQKIPIDAFPDVTPVQVNVFTESSGLAAEDVEQLLTFPIESGLAGLPKVQAIRSISLFGLSYVAVYFEDDVDIYFARRLVAERLQEVGERIPSGYGKPELGPNSSGLGQVFWYTVERADEKLKVAPSDMDLRTLQDWTVRLILRTAPGVDDVLSWGGQERQYQAVLDPQALFKYGVTFREMLELIAANNRQVGGQYINIGKEQFLVRGLGLIRNETELGNIVVKTVNGTPVHLHDVAKIGQGSAMRFGAVTRDGKEVVLGIALARIGENAKNVVDAIKTKLETLQQALPADVVIRPIYDRTVLVKEAVATATTALVEGALLVALVLFLFLGEVRSALVVIVALPLAMLIAFICMERFDLSANLMSLAGLAIGIGMMVDGAVVMVENSFRLMAQHRAHGGPVNRTQVVLAAAREVANPIAFAILIIIVVFLPLFSLQGLEGKLFKPMAFNISFAMAGSMILALTLIPVLAALLLRPKEERDTLLMRLIKRSYVPLLEWVLLRKKGVALVSSVVLAASLVLFMFLGREFIPQLQEGAFIWRLISIPSTSLDESIALSKRAEAAVGAFPEVTTAVSMIGRSEKADTEDVNSIEMYVGLKPVEEWTAGRTINELAAAMRESLEKAAPTAVISLTQPIQMRVEELISGVRAPLAAKVYGEDLAVVSRLASEVKDVVGQVRGATELSLEANTGKPQIRIIVDREGLARYGLNADDVLQVVRAGIGQEPVSTLIDGVRRFGIALRLDDAAKADPAAIAAIPLRTSGGSMVPLSEVARIELAEGRSFIRREQLQRYAVVQMDVRGRDIDGFVKEAQAKIRAGVKLPPGYWIEWGGAFENEQRAMTRLAIIVPLTIFFIFILLYTAFNSVRFATMILANVPFAAVGGVLSLFLTGQYLSVPSAIGFVAVFGVAMLNGIVLVSFFNELRTRGLSVAEAVRQGALLRLRPVLMTASVAVLGLLPMLFSHGVGAETQRPLATVVVGGLITSTILTLMLLPAVYEWVETRRTSEQSSDSKSRDT